MSTKADLTTPSLKWTVNIILSRHFTSVVLSMTLSSFDSHLIKVDVDSGLLTASLARDDH